MNCFLLNHAAAHAHSQAATFIISFPRLFPALTRGRERFDRSVGIG
jgi:hypothetical protein